MKIFHWVGEKINNYIEKEKERSEYLRKLKEIELKNYREQKLKEMETQGKIKAKLETKKLEEELHRKETPHEKISYGAKEQENIFERIGKVI